MHGEHKILVVNGDIHLGKFLKRQLGHKNYQVDVMTDGKDANHELCGNRYDLVILDLNLPGTDAIDLLKKIHQTRPRPRIVVLTPRDRTEDVVCSLDEGADDCIKKPFSFIELTARVGSLLSRHHAVPAAIASVAGDLSIDRGSHQAFRGTRRIELTLREFELLECLMNNMGKAVSRKSLMEDVWKVAYDATTNIVDVYMKYLRDKIDIDGETKLIRTIRGIGYVLGDGCDPLPRRSVEPVRMPAYQSAAALNSLCAA
jgi:DNA-binding response OmpR family regulator